MNVCIMELSFYHLCTSENHSDIFIEDSDFKTGVNLLALSISLYSDLDLYCFEFMSNHLHLLISGSKDRIDTFFKFYIKMLSRNFRAEGKPRELINLSYSCHPVESISHLLNVIAYIHRNASVVDNRISPYTYKWGTGRYYYNPEAIARYNSLRQKLTLNLRQLYSHSRKFDNVTWLYELDNYISPLSFCRISEGERLFMGAGQYMYMLAKNVESSASISKEIGERITYNDYELYPVVVKMADKFFGTSDITALSANQKLQLAKALHYDYNSGNKQLCRLLKINISVVNELFPLSSIDNIGFRR